MQENLDLFSQPEKVKKTCNHCGSKIVEYRFGFNTGLASCLQKMIEYGSLVKISEIGLTKSQYTNITKMRHWKLIVPAHNEESKKKRGHWAVTEFGDQFFKGKRTIPMFVVTVKGDFVRYEGNHIHIRDALPGWDHYDHYKQQARRQL